MVRWVKRRTTKGALGEMANLAKTQDLELMNTLFIKRLSHLPSFYDGNTQRQIDYILMKRRQFIIVTDCKAYETTAS